MQQPDSPNRQRKRKNYIQEWMEYRGLKPKDIQQKTGAAKDLEWKWRKLDNFPTEEYLALLLELLRTERECLFSPPPGGKGEGAGGPFYAAPPTDSDEMKARLIEAYDKLPDMLKKAATLHAEELAEIATQQDSSDHPPKAEK